MTFTRPAQAALLPTLVDTPDELTAANVVAGWVESAGVLAGPALAGVLIALGGPGAAVALFALSMAAAAAAVTSIAAPGARSAGVAGSDVPDRTGAGLSALRADPGLAALVALLGAQFVAIGALDVLVVVLAIGVLGLGPSGAGYLNAAFGLGGVLGGAVTLLLIGRRALVAPMVAAAVVWGALFAVLGVRPTVLSAFALLTAAGVARSVLDVAGRTILQRATPAAVRGRVFGMLEGVSMLGLAVGSILVPAIVAVNGAKSTLVAIGALLALVALAPLARLRALERATPVSGAAVGLLRRSPIFESLGAPELEALARALVRVPLAAGARAVREGELGDRFYLIERGALDVSIGGAEVAALGPGDGFGEIALLREVPRTATVTARTEAIVQALERGPFLEAVTGSGRVHEAAERLVAERLARASAAASTEHR